MAKIVIETDRSAEHELSVRARRLTPRDAPLGLTPLERGIHFLRGVNSRATMALPAFYLFHGSAVNTNVVCTIDGYPGLILKHFISFTSIGTLALACRKAFDHAADGMTGANFAKNSDATLGEHAEYWARSSKRPPQDAYAALHLLRSVFRDCAKTDRELLKGAIPLGRRIGLLKQYANRSAAHLSLEKYAVSTIDCAHVVAALALIGEIIRSFDSSSLPSTYFDTLDEGAFSAAKQLFPATPGLRLFQHMKFETQARLCWQWGAEQGRQMLFAQLPHAIDWW